jgi:hypothetical protein
MILVTDGKMQAKYLYYKDQKSCMYAVEDISKQHKILAYSCTEVLKS